MPGFGHGVLRKTDPRYVIQLESKKGILNHIFQKCKLYIFFFQIASISHFFHIFCPESISFIEIFRFLGLPKSISPTTPSFILPTPATKPSPRSLKLPVRSRTPGPMSMLSPALVRLQKYISKHKCLFTLHIFVLRHATLWIESGRLLHRRFRRLPLYRMRCSTRFVPPNGSPHRTR